MEPQLCPPLTQGFGRACCCSSGATNRKQPIVMQGGLQVPLLEAAAMCNLGLGCVSQTIGETRTRSPAPSRPAWTQQMLRLLTEMPASMPLPRPALPSTVHMSSLHLLTLAHPCVHPACTGFSDRCQQCCCVLHVMQRSGAALQLIPTSIIAAWLACCVLCFAWHAWLVIDDYAASIVLTWVPQDALHWQALACRNLAQSELKINQQ